MNTDPATKPAWLTTEFWLTVIPTILFLYKMLTGKDTSGIDIAGLATLAAGIAAAGYAISRALTKRAAIQANAVIANTKLSIAHDVQSQELAHQHETTLRRNDSGLETYLTQIDGRIAQLEMDRIPQPRKTTPRKTTRSTRR